MSAFQRFEIVGFYWTTLLKTHASLTKSSLIRENININHVQEVRPKVDVGAL